MENKRNRFDIDFFEFSFLVEACIPPVPIARHMFFEKVIDVYYHGLTADERKRLYEWLLRTPRLKYGMEQNEELCKMFAARYNPDNQYMVTVKTAEGIFHKPAFLYEGTYRIGVNTFLNEAFFVEVKKIQEGGEDGVE